MQLLTPVPLRYVMLVVDDRAGSMATQLARTGLPIEATACPSNDAARRALLSGRRYSAVVTPRFDADLATAATRAGAACLAVPPGMSPALLATAIERTAAAVPRADRIPDLGPAGPEGVGGPNDPGGRLVAVCGPGGTGASSVAAALASDFGRPAASGGHGMRVLLADLALQADQAFLAGVADAGSGLLDLIEAGRYRPLTSSDAWRHTVSMGACRLLPGLRRRAHWTAVSPALFDGMLSDLLGLFALVIADVTADFDGDADTGSIDVEERNHMARASAQAADVVVVVGLGPDGPGAAGALGRRRMARVVDDLLELGVDPARIQPVVSHRGPGSSASPAHLCGLPEPPVDPPSLTGAVAGLLGRMSAPDRRPRLVRISPGSLGCLAP